MKNLEGIEIISINSPATVRTQVMLGKKILMKAKDYKQCGGMDWWTWQPEELFYELVVSSCLFAAVWRGERSAQGEDAVQNLYLAYFEGRRLVTKKIFSKKNEFCPGRRADMRVVAVSLSVKSVKVCKKVVKVELEYSFNEALLGEKICILVKKEVK